MRLLAVGLVPIALLCAQLKAESYWAGPPPCGRITIVPVKLGRGADSSLLGRADLDGCRIELNASFKRWPWPALCTVVIHEAGHLRGLTHESPYRVMRGDYGGAIRSCRRMSPWLELPGRHRDVELLDWPT